MQVTIENNQFYIEDFYKPELLAGNTAEGIKELKNSHALIIKEYQQAMKNDGQLVGMERISITEHIEAAVQSNIRFTVFLLSLAGKGENVIPEEPASGLPTVPPVKNMETQASAGSLPKIVDMSGELKGTDLVLTVMDRKYSMRGRFLNADVDNDTNFIKALSRVVELLGRTVELSSSFTGDNQLTDEELSGLNREIFSTIYWLLVLKQNIETLRINK